MVVYTLADNGMRAALEPMKDTDEVSIGLIFKAGSRYEDAGANGTANMLQQVILGNQNNLSINMDGFTGKGEQHYYVYGHKNMLDEMFSALHESVLRRNFTDEHVQEQRKRIFQEIDELAKYDGKGETWLADALSYPDHPLGRPVRGTRNTLGRITAAALTEFKDKHYNTGALSVSVAGDFSVDKLLGQIEKIGDSLPAGGPAGYKKAKMAFGAAVKNIPIDPLDYTIRYPSVRWASAHRPAIHLMSAVLDAKIRSRQDIGSVMAGYMGYEDTGYVGVGGSAYIHNKSGDGIRDELAAMKAGNISFEEFDRAKEAFLGELKLRPADAMDAMTANCSDMTLYGRPLGRAGKIEAMRKVTLDHVKTAAAKAFSTKPVVTLAGRDVEGNIDQKALFDKFTLS